MARRFGLTRPIVAWGPRDCTGCKHNTGLPGRDKYGDHDEGTCSKNQGHQTIHVLLRMRTFKFMIFWLYMLARKSTLFLCRIKI